jgi:hypothetical protein
MAQKAYIGKVNINGTEFPIGSTLTGTCATAAATAAKVGTLENFSTLETGVTIYLKMTYSNTASAPTLNVNATGAKPIKLFGSNAGTTDATSWKAGEVVSFTYDGTNWNISAAGGAAYALATTCVTALTWA